jgi:serine/threonine-protein kinase
MTWSPDTFLTGEIAVLLRSRLILVCLLFLLPTALLSFLMLLEGILEPLRAPLDILWFYQGLRQLYPLYFLLVTALSAFLIILWGRWPLTLQQLRMLEIGMYGSVVATVAVTQWLWYRSGWLLDVAVAGQESKLMQLAGDSLTLPWFLLIVLYGTTIPNTGRRCAVAVAGMATIAFSTMLILGFSGDTLAPLVFEDVFGNMSVWLGMAIIIATYGSYKLGALQQEAAKARQMGQYQLQRLLGSGGMGEVHLAEHRLLKRPCAVKLIQGTHANDVDSLARFEREVHAMANLNHPNALDIFDYGQSDDGTFYYAMEYLPGLNLEQLVDRSGPLPPERLVHLLVQVCGVLREAHGAGLVHRDIKPSNILVCERGGVYDFVKLLDFGLVQSTVRRDVRLTADDTVVGTPLYMSPEQAAGDDHLDARSDLYSLGVVAYLLATGQPAFARDGVRRVLAAHINEAVVPPEKLRSDIPPDLQAVIMKCLEKRRIDRPTNANELLRSLEQCRCAGSWSQEQAAAWWRQYGPTPTESATSSSATVDAEALAQHGA